MDKVSVMSAKVTIWNKNFICVMLANSCLGLANYSVNTLVSTYATFLGATALLVGALTGMFYGVAFAMRPISGPVTTKLDKRKLMIFSYVLGFIVNMGYALTGSIELFVAFRILNGVQFSIIGSLAMTVASDSLPREKLGSGLGFYGVTAALTMAVGPSIGIALKDFGTAFQNERFGFMLVFLFSAVCMAAAVIPSALIKLPKRTKEELASTGAWYKNIVASNAIAPAVIMMLICMGYALYATYLYPYAQAKGIVGISTFYTVYALFMLFARPISGKLIDKYGVFKLILLGAALFGSSFIIVGFSKSLVTLLIAAAVASIGFGTAQPAIQTMCIQSVAPIKRAVASNTNFFGMDMGFFLGPFVGSAIFTIAGDYSVMYMAMVVPVGLAMIILSATWKGYEKNRKQNMAEATEERS